MSSTTVDEMHREFVDLLTFLDEQGQVSLRNTVDGNFRKALLLAAASHFERRLTEGVLVFVTDIMSNDHVVTWLIRKRVVERQYHTWFDWSANNANRFFSMFGESFGRHMRQRINHDHDLASSVEAFMEIGRDRNRMVHQDYGSFSLEKTSDEIYQRYQSGTQFVEWFPHALREYSAGEPWSCPGSVDG